MNKDGLERVANGLPQTIEEGMFSLIDQIRDDSKNVKDFIKKVLSDRNFSDMKNDREFIQYLGSIYESVNEMDINDPIMMKLRAAQMKKNQQAAKQVDSEKENKNAIKIKALKKKRAEVMRDMEKEAEMEGGPIADRYGKLLNRIDNDIIKFGGNPMTESVNEGFYKNIMSDGGRNLFFAMVNDKTDDVKVIDAKTWLSSSLMDNASDVSKDRVIKAILKGQKQFNKAVEYNMWSKKNNPSFEQKMDYFFKNGFISNITKKGIRVYESVNEAKAGDFEMGDFVHFKSKNKTGMVKKISGDKVTIMTIKGDFTGDIKDIKVLYQDNVNEGPKFKITNTITQKEWDKKHKDFKSIIDGVPYVMMYNDKTGTHLVPVKIVKESIKEHKDCGCGCGGVTIGGCNTSLTEEVNNDREMVVGVAEIVSMVKDTDNRKAIAIAMMKKFNYEGVEYDQNEFLKMSGVSETLDERLTQSIKNFIGELIPMDVYNATTPQGKEKYKSFIRDLVMTLNRFYKQHNVDWRFTDDNFKFKMYSK